MRRQSPALGRTCERALLHTTRHFQTRGSYPTALLLWAEATQRGPQFPHGRATPLRTRTHTTARSRRRQPQPHSDKANVVGVVPESHRVECLTSAMLALGEGGFFEKRGWARHSKRCFCSSRRCASNAAHCLYTLEPAKNGDESAYRGRTLWQMRRQCEECQKEGRGDKGGSCRIQKEHRMADLAVSQQSRLGPPALGSVHAAAKFIRSNPKANRPRMRNRTDRR
mmetsp:Transcript_76100/g.127926  ORF Transcript_76100/g.127926 Transcript_76100/m.127926 type:complete len:225 (+) Transcript_76100:109-783(+)